MKEKIIEILETVDGEWMVTVNGFQWGPKEKFFDYAIGCSGQTWPTYEEARAAVRDNPVWPPS